MITSTKRFIIALTIAVSGLAWSGGPLLQAQETKEGIGISPTSLTLSADAGQEISGDVTVINPGDKPIQYRLYTSNFSIRNEEYEKDFDLTDPAALAPVSWFQLPAEPRQLAAQGQEKVSYTIAVPPGTASQGYYAVIFAETVAGEPDASGIERRKRVGSLVYVTVNGAAVQRRGSVASFAVPRWQRQTPVTAALRVRNEGNVHFSAKSQIRLKNVLGKVVHEAATESTILPATTRKISLQLPGAKPLGLYRVEGDVSFLDKTVTFGPRWVLVASPLWLGLWLAALAVLIIIVVVVSRRRRARRR